MFKVYLVAQVARCLSFVFDYHDAQPCGLCARKEKVWQLHREGGLEGVVLLSHVRLYLQTLQSIQDAVMNGVLLIG